MPQGQSWFDRVFSAPPTAPQVPLSQQPLAETNPGLAKLRDLIAGLSGFHELGPATTPAAGIGMAAGALLPIKSILNLGVRGGEEAAAAGARLLSPAMRYLNAEADEFARLVPPSERVGGRVVVSTRVPTAKNMPAYATGEAPLVTGIEEVAQDPEFMKKLADQLRQSPLVRTSEQHLNDRGILDLVADRSAQNMNLLIGRQDPTVAARSASWYPGGHQLANDIAARLGVSGDQGAALLASQSPSKEWHQNIELAQRIGNYWKEFQQTNPAFDQATMQQFANKLTAGGEEWVKAKKLTGADAQRYRQHVQRRIAATEPYLNIRWEELPTEQRAQYLRTHSEMVDRPNYPVYSPEGQIIHPVALNNDQSPRQLVWQSYENLERGLSILDDGSVENLSRQIGSQHKVRSFFNNLNVPADARSATVDTHHVAASHVLPIGGSAPEVKFVMAGPGSAKTGISGAHPVYRDAVVRVATERGQAPSAAQAVGWEAIRGAFSSAQRRDPALKAAINNVWDKYAKGQLTIHDVHANIADLAGPIRPPDWQN